MTEICLGAYETEAEALAAMAERKEPAAELRVAQDGDPAHPFRIWWARVA
jgi:hypothetical protein